MSQNSRAVTYTLRANTSGVPGLERFQQSLQNIVKVQEQIKRQGDVLAGLRDRTATVRLKFEAAALEREIKRIDGREIKLKIGLANLDGAKNDINTLRALLTSVGSNMQYRVTVNTTALDATSTRIQAQIVQLQSLIGQLRSLGGSGGAGGGGGAGGPGAGSGLSAAALDAIRNVERLNNLWTRNQISAQNYSQALQAMQTRLQEAARTAGVGTAEYARIDAAITRITQSLRGINTDSLNKIRTDAAAMRAAFDQATAGVSRNSTQFRQALQAYEQASAGLQTRLSGIASAGNLTTQQLGQINREVARLARELNTIQGGINHAGLSGSINNVAAGAMPILQQSGGALGMAAMNGAALVNTFRSIQQSSGTAGLALGGVGLAAAGVAATFVNLGSTGLDEMKKVERGMNILQANGVRDLKAVETQVASLQESLGSVGGAFTKGDLTLAMADIIKAGVSADDALKLMASSTRLAAAEQIGLNDASGLLLKNLRQYGLTMDDAAKTGDMLAKAGNLAAGTANDLSVGLGIVGTTGKQAKVEMHDLLAMLVTLDNVGMNAADVGANGLRAALAALSDITEKGKGVLKGMGIALEDTGGYARPAGDIIYDLAQKLQGMGVYVNKTTGELMGNGEAMKTVASIMDNRAAAAVLGLAGGWKDMGQQIKASSGELVNYSTTMMQGVEPAVRALQTAWKDAGAEFAKSFAGPLADFLNNTLTPLVKGLGAANTELEKLKKDQPAFGAKDYSLKAWLGRVKLTEADFTPDELNRIRQLLNRAQELENVRGMNNQQWDNVGLPGLKGVNDWSINLDLNPVLAELSKFTNRGLGDPSVPSKVTFDDATKSFFTAIFGQETGGKGDTYGVVNGIGALGKYQVMTQHLLLDDKYYTPGYNTQSFFRKNQNNIGRSKEGWDYQALGFDITPQQFLKNPAYQEAIAQAQMSANLQRRLNEAGGDLEQAVKEAAKDWYGRGKPLPGHPTPDQYAASVWNKFQQAAASATRPDTSGVGKFVMDKVKPGEFDPKIKVQQGVLASEWTSAFITSLKNQFVSDPRVDSDCGVIAAHVMGRLGVKLTGAANERIDAGKLAAQVKASGAQQILNTQELKPGDYVDFSGGKFGAKSGHHAGVVVGVKPDGTVLILNNPGGTKGPSNPNGKDVATRVDTLDAILASGGIGADVAFYRPKESPWAQKASVAATQGGAAQGNQTPEPNEKLKQTLAEAHRLIKQYGMAVASGNEVWISKATAAVNTFKKANKDAWTKDLDAEFKAAGKGVAAAANVTAAQISRAMELQNKVDAAQKAAQAKPNDKGLKVAYAEATAELKKWTEASGANAAALAAVNSTQEKAARSAGQYIATQKDLKTYGNDALKLYKALETAQKSGSAAAVTTAERNIAAWTGESQAKKAVFEAESAAYKIRQANADKATADEKTRAKNRLQTQQNLQKALAEGREADARVALDNLKRSQAAELALAQNSAAKRAEIVRQTGPAIIAAEDRLANLRRDRAVKEAQRVADEALKLPGADPKAIEATRVEAVRQAYRAAAADRARARADQQAAQQGANQTALQAQQQHERERKRLMAQAAAEARALRYADAEATLKRIQDNNKAELAAFRGTAQAKLALIRAQTQAEFDAAEVVARIRRDNALRDNANKYAGKPNDPNKLEADRQIRQAYADTVSGLRNTRAEAVRTAQRATQEAVDQAQQKYQGLIDAFSKKALSGSLTDEDVKAYWRDLNQALAEATKNGVALNPVIIALRDRARELGQTAPDLQETFQQVEDLTAQLNDADLMDSVVRNLYGGGSDGLAAALAGYGAQSIEELEVWNKAAADSLRRVYGGVLQQFQRDLDEQLARGQDAIREHAAQLEIITEEYDRSANAFISEKGDQDQGTVDRLKKLGPGMMLQFLGGPGNEFFGDKFSQLGEEGRAAFMTAFEKFTPEQLSRLGVKFLKGFEDQIKPDDGAFEGIRAKISAGIGLAQQQDNKDEVSRDLGAVGREYLKLDRTSGTYASTLRDQLIPELRRLLQVATDPEMKAGIQGTLDFLTGEVDAARELTRVLNEGELKKLDVMKSAGELSGQDYITKRATLLREQENAEWEERKRGLEEGSAAYRLAYQQHRQRLTDIDTDEEQAGRDLTRQTEARNRETARARDAADLEHRHALNLVSERQYLTEKEALAVRAENEEHVARLQTMKEGSAEYEAEVAAHQQRLGEITNQGVRDRVALEKQQFQEFLGGLNAISGALGRFGAQGAATWLKFGADMANAAAQGVNAWKKAETAFGPKGSLFDKLGAVGGLLGVVGAVVNAVMDLSDAIESSNPALNAWKKSLSEVAALEKSMMGNKTVGGAYGMNGWDNPYHEALSKDAANRETLAGSKWYQRLAWDLFGGRPEVMKDDLAKTMSTAAAIFNDFGQSVYSTMESALMDAIDKGDFSDVGKNISKSLNTFVQRMYVQTVISKSRLKDLVKQLADEQTAGKDTAGTRAAIEAEMRSVAATVEAGAVSLPGFGEGATTGDTSASTPATSPQVGANFYVANSSKIDLFDNAVQRADAMYQRHEAVLTRHGDVLTRHADVLERVLRDGIPLIDTQGNYRGALR